MLSLDPTLATECLSWSLLGLIILGGIVDEIKINLSERFEHLANAPIVEAVIEVRAQTQTPWEEPLVSEKLKPQLAKDYPELASQNRVHQQVTFGAGNNFEAKQSDLGWRGLRFQSADKQRIAQFNRDGFTLSWLKPYKDWELFRGEALRLWNIYTKLSQPTEAQRLGLRFINQFELPVRDVKFEDYINPHPTAPRGIDFPFQNFLHQDTFVVPGYTYVINLVKTVIPPQDSQTEGVKLILDIDVICGYPCEPRGQEIESRLNDMRWLKNKVFFGTVTEKALKRFR
jgi:uncharacterized protein (TIGR04255 family)